MKKFKTESQKILNIMINSIYTHKEIFIRELLSNASDAIDKLYYKSLKENLSFTKEDFSIYIEADKTGRKIRISDNGIGMTKDELDSNLGVIAKSGSLDFKQNLDEKSDIDIIGQFGVGFYSAFMVSEKVEVVSKAYGEDQAYMWYSDGTDGYTIKEAEKENFGTEITMYLKQNTKEEDYDEFLSEYKIKELVKKYSDYIRYPIKMDVEKTKEIDGENEEKKTQTYIEKETLNSMVPLWKKMKKDIKEEDYNNFYKDTFYDYADPLKVINTSAEGAVNYKSILFIPSKAPYNYYTKGYEKGLRLYSNGVLITDKCAELLPDYFSFIKGLVDSELTLNISRETIQHNHQLKKIEKILEKKIKSELTSMMENDRETYEKFFAEFGLQFKYGLYDNWGVNKDTLKDLVLFHSLNENKLVSFKEYFDKMKENQKFIYYATGKSIEAIKVLPQTEKILDYGFDILCFTDDVDEFAIKFLGEFEKKEFKSISSGDLGLENEVEIEETDKDKEILNLIKESLGDKIAKVKLSSRLKSHPVCLTAEGEVSIEMEKVFNAMPNAQNVSAQKILEINSNHSIYKKIADMFDENKESVKDYGKILYDQALLIEGLPIENPVEYANLVCEKLSK